MPSGPPARWDKYSNIGEKIENTRFVAFKVPLKQSLCKNLPDNERFTIPILFDHMKSTGQEIKLVIDLTNTAKYYNPNEITKCGVKYKKLYTVGHSVPNSTVVRLFTAEVDDFLKKNSQTDSLIGVHCTHGVNRTGYLICRYMIDKLNITPDDAIEGFAAARGHPIERENYIKSLKISQCEEESGTSFQDGHEEPEASSSSYYNRRKNSWRYHHSYHHHQDSYNGWNGRYEDRMQGWSQNYNSHRYQRHYRDHDRPYNKHRYNNYNTHRYNSYNTDRYSDNWYEYGYDSYYPDANDSSFRPETDYHGKKSTGKIHTRPRKRKN